jgi:hypothetical protein
MLDVEPSGRSGFVSGRLSGVYVHPIEDEWTDLLNLLKLSDSVVVLARQAEPTV